MIDGHKSTIADRLEDADLEIDRFIDVVDGEKKSVDHERHPPEELTGSYGIYAHGSDELVILDVDDYGDLEDSRGYEALDDLPETLEQASPHGGTHKFYAVAPSSDGRLVAAALEDAFGSPNLKASWGEVRTKNQYVVGAGSQLDGCGKDWCDDCADEDGGHYSLQADRVIAKIEADQLVEVLDEDPELSQATDDPADHRQPVIDSDLRIHDVLSRAYEPGERVAHPTHGSDTGTNFVVDEDGETWRCWRHSVTGSALHLLGMEEGIISCGDWQNRRLSSETWAKIFDAARDRGLDVGEPESSIDSTSSFDDEEVERGEAILRSQTTHDQPVGDLDHGNGGYGIVTEYTDDDGNVTNTVFDSVTNFTLETRSVLDTEETENSEFVIRVRPNHPTEKPYDVRVEPSVFNSADSFRAEVVTGRTTWFDPTNRKGIRTITILRYLRETVAAQPAPSRTGQPYIGLSDSGDEFVTPVGSLTADGWADRPEYEFYSKGGEGHTSGPLQQKWELDADEEIEIDEDDVGRICELLAKSREPARGLPILGWFYAAPIKALIHEWEHEFPLLSPHGDTGTGKTSIIETYMRAFGGTGEPLSSTDTMFTKEKHLAESRGFPIWIDEYKPTEMSERYLNHLHQRLKEVTKERTMPKGRPDLGMTMLHMRAPVVLSGEQKVSDPAVRRRSILTNLTREPTRDGTEMKAAFGELTGTAYEDEDEEQHYPDGFDLRQHAMAYYRWILSIETDELRQRWNDARETVKEFLERFGVTLEASEQRGLQTIVFGTDVHRAFALDHGADEDQLPGQEDIRNACLHVIENVGKDGQRREHADEFLEALSLAATEEYIEHGVNHRVLESAKYGSEVLAVHMPSCFSAVKRYVRDSNLEDQYNLLSKTDYVNSFANKANSPEGYVLETNKQTRGIENGRRTIHFDHEAVAEKLGGDFNISVFRAIEDREALDDGSLESQATPLAGLETPDGGNPYVSVTARVLSWGAGSDRGPAERGVLEDSTGVVDIVDWFGCKTSEAIEEGGCYLIENARIGTYEGSVQLEIVQNTTSVREIQSGAGHIGPEDSSSAQQPLDAAPDGGVETDEAEEDTQHGRVQILRETIAEIGPASEEEIVEAAAERGMEEDMIKTMIEKFAQQRQILRTADGWEAK